MALSEASSGERTNSPVRDDEAETEDGSDVNEAPDAELDEESPRADDAACAEEAKAPAGHTHTHTHMRTQREQESGGKGKKKGKRREGEGERQAGEESDEIRHIPETDNTDEAVLEDGEDVDDAPDAGFGEDSARAIDTAWAEEAKAPGRHTYAHTYENTKRAREWREGEGRGEGGSERGRERK